MKVPKSVENLSDLIRFIEDTRERGYSILELTIDESHRIEGLDSDWDTFRSIPIKYIKSNNMLQKIKYPVGSKIQEEGYHPMIIGTITSDRKLAALFHEDGDFYKWVSAKDLDDDYSLVSSPRWKPEINEYYYFLRDDGEIGNKPYKGDDADRFRIKNDNVKRTFPELQKKIDEIDSREI